MSTECVDTLGVFTSGTQQSFPLSARVGGAVGAARMGSGGCVARCWVSEASDARPRLERGGCWLGFWLFDFLIVDASISARTFVMPSCFVGGGVVVVWV
jgi:hypothetical protein